MKENSKAIIISKTDYMDLSAQLREKLELKIDSRYLKDLFINYSDKRFGNFKNLYMSDFLCTYLITKVPRNYIVSGKLLQGVKTWFNMYYADRLSVIDKFKICYNNTFPLNKWGEGKATTVAFCKFLINELLSTLAESRWQALTDHSE